MQAHQLGDSSSPPRNNYEEQTQPRRLISQPRTEAHYELEFENESSIYAHKLFVDAERMSLMRMDLSELNIAENGNQSHHSYRSFTRSTSHNTSLSRTSSNSDPIITTATTTRPPSHSPTRLRTCGIHSNSPVQTSPERERRKSREEVTLLRQVPEDGGAMEFHSESRSQSHDNLEDVREDVERDRLIKFPVLVSESPPPHHPDSQSLPVEDADDEEEEQWILDEELARQGLYRGSYRFLISLYSLTPAFTLLVFLALAFLPTIAYPLPPNTTPSYPYPYAPYLPYPLPEILTATAFWALSYLLNSSIIFSFFSFILSHYPPLALCTSSLVQSAIVIILRQTTIPVLLISCGAGFDRPTWRDVAFRRTWWVALGWAAAEAAVGIKQGYEGIALYRDVLVSVRRVASAPRSYYQKPSGIGIPLSGYGSVGVGHTDSNGRESPDPRHRLSSSEDQVGAETGAETQPLLERHSSIVSGTGIGPRNEALYRDAIEEEVERDVDELIALRARGELEDLYGMPFIHVPPFIPCLHRLNSAFFVLGSTLLVTAAYMRSSLSLKFPSKILSLLYDSSLTVQQQHHQAQAWPKLHGNTQLFITLPTIVLLQWFLALLHTPYILPRIGVQTFVYVGLLVSLGVFFTGLGVWEGIV